MSQRSKVDKSILNEEKPDLHRLFNYYNQTYFDNQLDMVVVRWSKKMLKCTGLCTSHPGSNDCVINLSEPVLKLRPKKDTLETLLHEMIHAYLFFTDNDTDEGNYYIRADGHGAQFRKEAKRIEDATNLKISINHKFNNEIQYYYTHVWQCDGSCRDEPPNHGLVKRTSNRPPGGLDLWFARHKKTCGGTFNKIVVPAKKRERERKPEKLLDDDLKLDETLKKLKME